VLLLCFNHATMWKDWQGEVSSSSINGHPFVKDWLGKGKLQGVFNWHSAHVFMVEQASGNCAEQAVYQSGERIRASSG